jgi:DNA-directed RNA polymerase specialized sigma24 family protein
MADAKRMLIERLFAHHRAALQAFFYRRVKAKDDTADLVQKVYLRMLRVKDTDAIKNPEGYLFAVAGNLVFEQSVLNRRQPTSVETDRPLDHADAATPTLSDRGPWASRVHASFKVRRGSHVCSGMRYMFRRVSSLTNT